MKEFIDSFKGKLDYFLKRTGIGDFDTQRCSIISRPVDDASQGWTNPTSITSIIF